MAKIIALIISIGLWFFVMKEQNPVVDVTYTVPVHVQNLNQQYLLEGAPTEIQVKLQGPRNTLLALNQHNLFAYIDASQLSIGEHEASIEFNAPSGTIVDSITPEVATIYIDEFSVKEINVEVQPKGTIGPDFSVVNTDIIPKVVTISGPKRLVSQVAHVYLPVDMDGQVKVFDAEGALVAVDQSGNKVEVTITPHQGKAKINLKRTRFTKVIPVYSNIVGTPAANFIVRNVQVQPAQITISGTEDAVAAALSAVSEPINISGMNKDLEGEFAITLPVNVTSPAKSIKVKIEIAPQNVGGAVSGDGQ